jgi:hypothetical protein
MVAIFIVPFLFSLGAGRRLISAEFGNRSATAFTFVSDEVFLAGDVCEIPLLLWNKNAHKKTIITNIQPGRL